MATMPAFSHVPGNRAGEQPPERHAAECGQRGGDEGEPGEPVGDGLSRDQDGVGEQEASGERRSRQTVR